MINKIYRKNVAAIILSSNYPNTCSFFVGERNDIKNAWQFPQGGIDDRETPKEALFRELKEEIGTNNIEILAEYPEWISYDFPSAAVKKMYKFDGQIQKYFLVRLKSEAVINITTKEPEFINYKFVNYEDLLTITTSFKKKIYKEVLTYFRKEGYI